MLTSLDADDVMRWDWLVADHLPALLSFSARFGLSERAQLDVIELTWLRLAQRMPNLPEPLRPWLLQCVADVAGQTVRHAGASKIMVLTPPDHGNSARSASIQPQREHR